MAQNIRDQIHQPSQQATVNNSQQKSQGKSSMDTNAAVGSISPNKYQRFGGTDAKTGEAKGTGSSSITGQIPSAIGQQQAAIQLQPLRIVLGGGSSGPGFANNNNSGQQFADIMGQYQEQFTIDKQEYQSVFRMFDKEHSGQISVGQVNQYIQKFEQMHLNLSNNPSSTNGSTNAGKPEQTPKKPHGGASKPGVSYTKQANGVAGPVGSQVASQLGGYHRLNKQQIVTVTSSNGNSVQSYSKGANFGAGTASNAAANDLRMGARRVYQNSEKKAVIGQAAGSVTTGIATLGKVQNGSQGVSANGLPSNAGAQANNSQSNAEASAAKGNSQKQRFQTERAGTQEYQPQGSQATTAATAGSSCKPVRVLHNPNANGVQNGATSYNQNIIGPGGAANGQNMASGNSAAKSKQTNGASPVKRGTGGGIGSGLTSSNQNGNNAVLQLKLSQIDSSSSGTQLNNVLKNGVANMGTEGFQQATNNSQQNNNTDDVFFASGDKQGRRQSGAMDEAAIALAGEGLINEFPNGKSTLNFDEFIEMIKDSCSNTESAENYLVFAFSMFDRHKKGYITGNDLKIVFQLLGSEVSDEEINMMVKIAGVKSHDKINFKEFVDFFYKTD